MLRGSIYQGQSRYHTARLTDPPICPQICGVLPPILRSRAIQTSRFPLQFRQPITKSARRPIHLLSRLSAGSDAYMIELAFTSIGDLRVPLLTVPRKARIIRVYGCPNLP